CLHYSQPFYKLSFTCRDLVAKHFQRIIGNRRLSFYGQQNENVYEDVSGGQKLHHQSRIVALFLSLDLIVGGIIVSIWSGRRFAWDVGNRLVTFAGTLCGLALLFLGFDILRSVLQYQKGKD